MGIDMFWLNVIAILVIIAELITALVYFTKALGGFETPDHKSFDCMINSITWLLVLMMTGILSSMFLQM